MIDLHVHTRKSDCSLSIKEILLRAKAKNITHIAITDHDTMQGIDEALYWGEKIGINIIPGLEISAYDFENNKRAHILGYYPQSDHPAMEKIYNELAENRFRASYAMVQRLINMGYDIDWDEINQYYAEESNGVYKQHIMHALMDRGYCDSIYADLYYQLFKRSNQPSEQGKAFIPMQYIDAAEAIQAVKQAGGVAVLAHPCKFGNFDVIGHWTELGLDGIEVYHPGHSRDDIEKLLICGRKYHLLITGGSDFHGFYNEAEVELGRAELNETCIAELRKLTQLKPACK
jgi:predicted metal-dependent phosphoesterase TrpH